MRTYATYLLPGGEAFSAWLAGEMSPGEWLYIWIDHHGEGSFYRLYPLNRPVQSLWSPFQTAREAVAMTGLAGEPPGRQEAGWGAAEKILKPGDYGVDLRLRIEGREVEYRGLYFQVHPVIP